MRLHHIVDVRHVLQGFRAINGHGFALADDADRPRKMALFEGAVDAAKTEKVYRLETCFEHTVGLHGTLDFVSCPQQHS